MYKELFILRNFYNIFYDNSIVDSDEEISESENEFLFLVYDQGLLIMKDDLQDDFSDECLEDLLKELDNLEKNNLTYNEHKNNLLNSNSNESTFSKTFSLLSYNKFFKL